MKFIEMDYNERRTEWSMADLHSHNHYEFYFLCRGERGFFIENTLYTITETATVIIPPFTMHKTEGGPFARYNLNISKNCFDNDELEILNALCKQRVVMLGNYFFTDVLPLLEQMRTYRENFTPVNSALFRITAKTIISHVFLARNNNSERVEQVSIMKKVPPVILLMIKFLNDRFTEELTLDDISKTFFISRSYIAKLFKKHTGFSVSEYILNLRINRAKELLTSSNRSVEEIASLTGFSSANYFGLIFKQKVGLSPLHYRKFVSGDFT